MGIIQTRGRPAIVDAMVSSNAGTPLTITLPRKRHAGLLAVVFIGALGGTATPGLPSGWTTMGSSASSASIPGNQIAYKFLNGSEALTTSSASTGASAMNAICLAISGCISNVVPQTVTNSTGSSTTPNPTFLGATTPYNGILRILHYLANSSTITETQFPANFGRFRILQQNNSLTNSLIVEDRLVESSLTPGQWTISASQSWRASHAAIRR
jgi:hypothetical protein